MIFNLFNSFLRHTSLIYITERFNAIPCTQHNLIDVLHNILSMYFTPSFFSLQCIVNNQYNNFLPGRQKKYNICTKATVVQFHQNDQCSVELARTVWVTIKTTGHNFLCMPGKSSSPGMSFLKCLQLNDKSSLYVKQRCGLLKTFYHNPDKQLPYLNLDN